MTLWFQIAFHHHHHHHHHIHHHIYHLNCFLHLFHNHKHHRHHHQQIRQRIIPLLEGGLECMNGFMIIAVVFLHDRHLLIVLQSQAEQQDLILKELEQWSSYGGKQIIQFQQSQKQWYQQRRANQIGERKQLIQKEKGAVESELFLKKLDLLIQMRIFLIQAKQQQQQVQSPRNCHFLLFSHREDLLRQVSSPWGKMELLVWFKDSVRRINLHFFRLNMWSYIFPLLLWFPIFSFIPQSEWRHCDLSCIWNWFIW